MKSHRFEALDGLRGVAAICIVLFHARNYLGLKHLMPHAYLAVDFFFVLSGFVIAYGFETRLASRQLSLPKFWVARVLRLAPLSVLGTVIALFAAITFPMWLPPTLPIAGQSVGFYAMAIVSSALMPIPHYLGDLLEPLNPPAWSLLFEMMINLVFAAAAPFLKTWRLVAVIAISAVGLGGYAVWQHTLDHGPTLATAAIDGTLRVSFGFGVGVLFHRLWRAGRRAPNVPIWALCAALLLVFQVPQAGPLAHTVTDLFAVFLVLPLIVWFGASSPESGRLCQVSGQISYPLYAIHFLPLVMASRAFAALGFGLPVRAAFLAGSTAALCAGAFAAMKLDTKLRAWLKPYGDRVFPERRAA